jgi:hypothetical protein
MLFGGDPSPAGKDWKETRKKNRKENKPALSSLSVRLFLYYYTGLSPPS